MSKDKQSGRSDPAGNAFLDFWDRRPSAIDGPYSFDLAEAAFAAGAAWGSNMAANAAGMADGQPVATAMEAAAEINKQSTRVAAAWARKGGAK